MSKSFLPDAAALLLHISFVFFYFSVLCTGSWVPQTLFLPFENVISNSFCKTEQPMKEKPLCLQSNMKAGISWKQFPKTPNLRMSSCYRKLKAHWAGKHASVCPANSSGHCDNLYPSFFHTIYSQTVECEIRHHLLRKSELYSLATCKRSHTKVFTSSR